MAVRSYRDVDAGVAKRVFIFCIKLACVGVS